MDPFHFACPHCSSRLRVREKLFVGRHVDCPECGQSLLIVEQKGELAVQPIERKVAQPATKVPQTSKIAPQPAPNVGTSAPVARNVPPASTGQAGSAGSSAAQATSAKATAAGTKSTTPASAHGLVVSPATLESQNSANSRRRTMILVCGVVGVALGLVAVAYLAGSFGTNSDDDGLPAEAADARNDAIREGQGEEFAGHAAPQDAKTDQAEPQPDQVELRLTRLGQVLFEHLAAEQAFPSGTVPILGIIPENRLSWMALLADRFGDSAVHPAWDRPWNAQQNEAFVRRRLTIFQNPDIAQLTGSDGYPASPPNSKTATPELASSETSAARESTISAMARRIRC
jgi:hypothetical protein